MTRKKTIEEKNDMQMEMYNSTSDEVIDLVNDEYRRNVSDASNKINTEIEAYWDGKFTEKKKELEIIINNSDALSEKEKQDVVNAIQSSSLVTKQRNDEEFVKEKYLMGMNLLAKRIESKKLRLKKIQKDYDKLIDDTVEELIDDVNTTEFRRVKKALNEIKLDIQRNITKYSPELSKMQQEIESLEEIKSAKEDRKEELSKSKNKIRKLISWDSDEILVATEG